MAPEPSTASKLLGEFLGTYFLVLTICGCVLTAVPVWGGVTIGSSLMVFIFALGGVSGGNFNPAVSLALLCSAALGGPGLPAGTVAEYMLVQLAGGALAAATGRGIFSKSAGLGPTKNFGLGSAVICEVVYTFMLCFVVLNVAVASKNSPNKFFGLAIGFVVVAGAYGAGAVSGGSFNPAVSFGLCVLDGGAGLGNLAVYVAAEFLGAVLAACGFAAVRREDFGAAKSLGAELVSEFLGTFMLVMTVGLNVLASSAAGAFSIAASLMCMIFALGNVSGAHFNPAVTVGALLSNRCEDLTPGKAIAFIVAQLLGGSLAADVYHSVYALSADKVEDGKYLAAGGVLMGSAGLGPGADFTLNQAVAAEYFFTFVLSYVVLAVAVSTSTGNDQMFGLAIGACVTVGGNAIGAVSGGSLNPAVSVGLSVGTLASKGQMNVYTLLNYIAAEILGGVTAAIIFKTTHLHDLAVLAAAAADAKKEAAAYDNADPDEGGASSAGGSQQQFLPKAKYGSTDP